MLTVGTLSTHSARRDRAGNGAATALLYSLVLKVGTLFLEGLRGEAVLAMELPKRHATSLVGSQSGYSEYSQWALTVGPQRTHSGYSEYSHEGLLVFAVTRSPRRCERQVCCCAGVQCNAEFSKHTQGVL